jgi:hypothetical protein
MRPGKDVNILSDLLKSEDDSPRTLWSTKVRPCYRIIEQHNNAWARRLLTPS